MKKIVMIAVLSSSILSACQYLEERGKEPVLAGPYMNGATRCDAECKAKLEADMKKTQSSPSYRVPQADDPYEYKLEVNGKTVICRPGLNTGFRDGINHNVICE